MKNIIITIVLLFVLAVNSKATAYYVAKDGNDTNLGTENEPWLTIQKATNVLQAGDIVWVKAGTYNERVIIQHSGAIDNYIVFANYQNDVVTIDGSGITWGALWNGLVDITDKSYIEIRGFNVTNADYAGIWVENAASIIVKNNYTYDTYSSGIGVWDANNITVEGNEVVLACHEGVQECITISNSHHCEVLRNEVHDNGAGVNGGEGIDVKQGSHDVKVYENNVHHINNRIGIYVDAWDAYTYNIEIFNNTVHHCGNGGITIQSEMGGTLEYVKIYNNLSYYNKYEGIAVGSVTADPNVTVTPVRHIEIINNTCYHNGSTAFEGGWGFGILVNNDDAEDIIIRNNICSENNAQIAIQAIISGGIVDHNLIDGFNETPFSLNGNDAIIGAPLFVDTNDFDFHLQNNSPAIDKGSSINAPLTDFDNNIRPHNGFFDIGAYEYDAISDVRTSIVTERLMEVYPNPFTDKLTVEVSTNSFRNHTLQLFDSNGRSIRKVIGLDNKNGLAFINRGDLSSGLYMVVLSNGNQVITCESVIIE